MSEDILSNVSSAADIKSLNTAQLQQLCEEIRTFLIESVSHTGGHLSSNLGTIELTVALHKVFDTPHDQIVFDVGHQCYTHKILTGRKEQFNTLRQLDGISGFPNFAESRHDTFISGHGNTAVSAAIGLAYAKKMQGDDGKVIAIVGDGAFGGGMVYEGLNNIGKLDNLIIILNDNKMSISKSVGAVSQYLTRLRTNPGYFRAKRNVESFLNAIPLIGRPMANGIKHIKRNFRRSLYHSTMFEEMGCQFVGPLDGHDVENLCKVFAAYKAEQESPLFLDVITVKGKGFAPAEENPGAFHGVSAFDAHNITDPDNLPGESFSTVFGQELTKLAEKEPTLCAITAAMKYGTGLQYFYKEFPHRFFDVGMAEQHAVTFAAGLARNGMVPVAAVYSTFLQRSYDQIIHDVCLQNLNVLFAVDRAGLVPGDGATHQGIYDAAFLSQQENFTVVSPCNYKELRFWLKKLIKQYAMPRALRYPRGEENPVLAALSCSGKEYDVYPAAGKRKTKIALVTYGAETAEVLRAAEMLKGKADVYKLVVIHPLPEGLAEVLAGYKTVLFAEEGIRSGGIGEHLAAALQAKHFKGEYIHTALPTTGVTHANVAQLREKYKLNAESIVSALNEGTL